MYNHFQLAIKYLQYYFSAANGRGHGTHSPFVFDFIKQVLLPSSSEATLFQPIENRRKNLLAKEDEFIEVKDLGAGSFSKARSKRSIASIAKGAAKHPKFARVLYHMIRRYKIDSVLELGTSLGLTTRYLALAGDSVNVQTIEGAPDLAAYTSRAFEQEGLTNTKTLVGDFNDVLPTAIAGMNGRKLFFIDGNHQYAPTMKYFETIMEVCGEEDILVFDDIHWSEGMEKAWLEIKNSERVTCSINLFFIGIVFLRKEFKEKLDFTIRF
ncbi:MAG: hypothetical protein RL642_409 [Bacteroidota bacterium]|jgi:predicted O-methyltransferase YrrM